MARSGIGHAHGWKWSQRLAVVLGAVVVALPAGAEPPSQRSPVAPAPAQDPPLQEASVASGLPLGAERPSAPQVIYRYRNREGRTVYTNFADSVPPEQRADAVVDLSHVSLNTELGNQIDAQLKAQHARLLDSEYCQNARAEVRADLWTRLWDEYAPLIVCGALLLLFLFATPFMLKRMAAPAWARTLTMAIPALAVAGIVLFGMMQANRVVSELGGDEHPCSEDTWDNLSDDPRAVQKHAALVQRLRQQVAAMEQIHDMGARQEGRGADGE